METEKTQKPVKRVAVGASNGIIGFTRITNWHHLDSMTPFSLHALEELALDGHTVHPSGEVHKNKCNGEDSWVSPGEAEDTVHIHQLEG